METYVEVLEKVLDLKGLEVLRSSRLLVACLNDLGGGSWKHEITLTARNFDDDVLQILYEAAIDKTSSLLDARNRVIAILESEMGLASSVATNLSTGIVAAIDAYTERNELTYGDVGKLAEQREAINGIGLDIELQKHSMSITWNRGWVSPEMVTDVKRMETILSNPYVLTTTQKILGAQEMPILLKELEREERPLLIIADDVASDAFSEWLHGTRRNAKCWVVATKAPGFGERRKRILEDIALVTNGQFVDENYGFRFAEVTTRECGQAQYARIAKDNFQIYNGAGAEENIRARIKQIEKEIQVVLSDFDREKLQERLDKLQGYMKPSENAVSEE